MARTIAVFKLGQERKGALRSNRPRRRGFSSSPVMDKCQLRLPILAVQKIADRLASFCVCFRFRFALFSAHLRLIALRPCLGSTALRTAVRKTRLVRLQFEFLAANHAGFDRKTHPYYLIGTKIILWKPEFIPIRL